MRRENEWKTRDDNKQSEASGQDHHLFFIFSSTHPPTCISCRYARLVFERIFLENVPSGSYEATGLGPKSPRDEGKKTAGCTVTSWACLGLQLSPVPVQLAILISAPPILHSTPLHCLPAAS